ncbi:hypothetical protein LEP1GSC188_1119 [Leptospira weilii serovar Topaz str. LT2116]|uniref:Uncharacterized protein n=1 Tax=Leptospira weilii serovar Topaz str. LT2116 TaxID=1088540 RepID=M3FHM3_9LEPT|nr:hypothetical protein LEP1GSC188_1119 [Leptospira weilii serovar Topaz str. LT2116]
MKKSTVEQPLTDKQLKESEELKKLRKENLKLKEENTILTKFAAMLSGEQNPD